MKLETAQKIVTAAIAHARKANFKPLTMALLDARGAVKLAIAEDGTSLKRGEIAHGKAHGALALGMGIRAIQTRADAQPAFISAVSHVVGGALILAVIAWRRQQQRTGGAGKQHPAVGKAYLPHQFLPLTAQQPVQEADLKGKVVLVNFWGYWCPPCRTEFPHLLDLEKSLQGNPDFRFVSVACSSGPSSDEVELRDRQVSMDMNWDGFCGPLERNL